MEAATQATMAGGSKMSTIHAAIAPARVAAQPRPSQSTSGWATSANVLALLCNTLALTPGLELPRFNIVGTEESETASYTLNLICGLC